MGTLSPDIRDSLGLSDGAIIFIVSASSAFLILGALPMGWLADRYRRGRIIGFANLFFGLMTALTGLATSGVALFFARLGVGSTKSNTFTVQSDAARRHRTRSRREGASAARSASVRVGDRHAQPADRRRARHVDRRAERLAVGVRPPGHSDLASSRSSGSCFPNRRAASSRSRTCSARSSRGRSAADLGRGGVRPAAADPHAEGGDHRLRGDRLRPLHRADPRQPVHGGRVRAGFVRARRRRHRRAASP